MKKGALHSLWLGTQYRDCSSESSKGEQTRVKSDLHHNSEIDELGMCRTSLVSAKQSVLRVSKNVYQFDSLDKHATQHA